jgi:hypothetical protein
VPSKPNPFANAFSAKNASAFQERIAAHMKATIRAEGHRPKLPEAPEKQERITARVAIITLMRREKPMTKHDVKKALPHISPVTINDILHVLGSEGVLRPVGYGPHKTTIWGFKGAAPQLPRGD